MKHSITRVTPKTASKPSAVANQRNGARPYLQDIVYNDFSPAVVSRIAFEYAPRPDGLADYRVPRYIEFRNSLPETMIGKVLRRILVEEERRKAESKASTSAP